MRYACCGKGGVMGMVGARPDSLVFTTSPLPYPTPTPPLDAVVNLDAGNSTPPPPNSFTLLPPPRYVILDLDAGHSAPLLPYLFMLHPFFPPPRYVVLDVDAGDDPFGLSDFGSKQHTIPARFVIALPTSEPSHYSTYNEFKVVAARAGGWGGKGG